MMDRTKNLLCIVCLFCGGIAFAAETGVEAPQTIPRALLRPQQGEALRYPRDLIIGELGRGEAPEEVYVLAEKFLAGLLGGDRAAPGMADLKEASIDALLAALKEAEPQKYRIGGGREDPPGSVSFLVRFLGKEKWIVGEIYFTQEEGTAWHLDDLVLEAPRENGAGKDPYPYDFTPYERFY